MGKTSETQASAGNVGTEAAAEMAAAIVPSAATAVYQAESQIVEANVELASPCCGVEPDLKASGTQNEQTKVGTPADHTKLELQASTPTCKNGHELNGLWDGSGQRWTPRSNKTLPLRCV